MKENFAGQQLLLANALERSGPRVVSSAERKEGDPSVAATSANPEITSKEIPAKIDERFYAESTDNPWGPAATEKLTATLIHLVPSGSRFGDVDCPAARAASAGAGPVTQRRPDRLRRIDRPRAALGGRRKSNQDWHVKACEAPPEGRGYLWGSIGRGRWMKVANSSNYFSKFF